MKKYLYIVFALMAVFCLGSCKNKTKGDYDYYFYEISNDATKLVPVGFSKTDFDKTDANGLIDEYFAAIDEAISESNSGYIMPGFGKVKPLDYKVDKNQVYVYFPTKYLELDTYEEVLTRAAIVKTIVQIEGIEGVAFYIKDAPLVDSNGNVIGFMNADTFAEDSADKLNDIITSEITLFFTNKNGDRLVEETQTVHYSSNISLEKVIVEQLIAGPIRDDLYPVMPQNTKLLGISVKDGTCYVNLNNSFLSNEKDIEDDVVIYSIVNSLVELPNINNVQISVDSKYDVMFMNTISLNQVFTRNLDIVDYEMETEISVYDASESKKNNK